MVGVRGEVESIKWLSYCSTVIGSPYFLFRSDWFIAEAVAMIPHVFKIIMKETT